MGSLEPCGPSLLCAGTEVIRCETGVQQGDPLAPLLFSLGLHEAIESIAEVPHLGEIWYLDDGVLRGPVDVVESSFGHLCPALTARGLRANMKKCELYTVGHTPLLSGALSGVQVVTDLDSWSCLGAPLREQSASAVQGVITRLDALCGGIHDLAHSFPAQALQLLRATTGACRVEFLLQALPASEVSSAVASHASTCLRKGLAAVLDIPEVPDEPWQLSLIPLRLGGLGLRDPPLIQPAARLSSLLAAKDRAPQMGAHPFHVDKELRVALSDYQHQLGAPLPEGLRPHKQLQAQLTEPLHRRALAQIVSTTDDRGRDRLNSLATPHATAWAVASPWTTALQPGELCCGLR